MKVTPLKIPGLLLLEPKVFTDERGFFFESFNQDAFQKATGLDVNFVQDNHSKSQKNVLRGLHYQAAPKAQGKLVHVIAGSVFDVVVDVREGSLTFGQWVGTELSADNKKQLWIPAGFAHGFLVLSETAEFLYKTTEYYSPEHERCLRWNDPSIAVEWPLNGKTPLVSQKDSLGVLLES